MTELTPELLRERLDRFYGAKQRLAQPIRRYAVVCQCGRRFCDQRAWAVHRAYWRRARIRASHATWTPAP